MFRPELNNLIPLKLYVPEWSRVQGVGKKTYPATSDTVFYGTFKTYGGTEKANNGAYTIEDTAVIECVYRPDIKADCKVEVCQTGAVYEIINEPENINMLNRYMRFKVRRVKGGA